LHFPALHTISLMGCTALTDTSLVPFLTLYGPQLQAMNLSGLEQITNNTIMTIRQVCKTLERLEVMQLGNRVTSIALMGLFLTPSHHISSQSTFITTQNHSNNLHNHQTNDKSPLLPLSSCLNNTPMHIGYLHTISFQGCLHLTDEIVMILCQYMTSSITHPSLQCLDISSCTLLTWRSVIALGTHLSSCLHHVNLSFLRHITQESLYYLFQQCYLLQEVSIWGMNSEIEKMKLQQFWYRCYLQQQQQVNKDDNNVKESDEQEEQRKEMVKIVGANPFIV